ncbi:MAG TPA: aminotransferase [Beijerinckiaceae bacterium]|nr:aminotransferase [Beijerinckiaceae bacterium]
MTAYSINPSVAAVEAPPIPSAQAWKRDYDGARGPMIDLTQAVPGTPPPADVLERLAMAAGSIEATRYGPILGDSALRQAHAGETWRLYGGAIEPQHVAITCGCNQAFVVTMLALARAGDAVILPAPWYFNHKMTLDMLGLETRVLACRPEAGFVPDPDAAERLIDGRCRALVLVSPNNPTGAIYPPQLLARFFDLCRRHRLALVLDETYRDFLPSDAAPHGLLARSDWPDTLIQLYSFSKSHALPGHRLGAIVAAPATIGEIAKVQDSLQICPARPAQGVVADSIESQRGWRAMRRDELIARGTAFQALFARQNRWRIDSLGAYFAFVAHPFTGLDSVAAARRLALEAGVLGLPGSYFGPGLDGHLRLAFANVETAGLADLPQRLSAMA